MRIAQGFRALGLSTLSGSTSRPLRPHLLSTISFTRPRRPSRTGYASSGEEQIEDLLAARRRFLTF
jgi:hypothetical protein